MSNDYLSRSAAREHMVCSALQEFRENSQRGFIVFSSPLLGGVSDPVKLDAETRSICAGGLGDGGESPRHCLVVIGDTPLGADFLESRGIPQNWRVRSVDAPQGDLALCVDALTDFLARDDSPDRGVLLGADQAAHAAFEIADRHPERVAAVVALLPGGEAAAAAGSPEPPCPALVLSLDEERDRIESAVADHLCELGRPAAVPSTYPVRLPPLTAMLLHDAEAMRQRAELGPVHRLETADATTTWIVTGHQAAREVLASPHLRGDVEITPGFRAQCPELAAEHRGGADTISVDAREHRRLRELIGRHLTAEHVARLRERVQRCVDGLLDGLPTSEEIDFVRRVAVPLPVLALCELFGVPEADRDYLHDWLVRRLSTPPPGAHEDVDAYLRRLIEAGRKRPGDDFIGWAVAAEGDRLAEDDLVSAARLLLVSGTRPTTTLLANGVAALLRHPGQWQRLVGDPGTAGDAAEELLRFVTPYPLGLPRRARCPVDEGGVRIPEGQLVAASLMAANRDPSVFTDPDVLDIGRAGKAHAAFGHEHHQCLGEPLARVLTSTTLEALARRFPAMALSLDGRGLQYRKNRVRYLLELMVVLEPRS
ncbi:cytochrome P450 [Streptomyces sp. NPDC020490]|uniref:cytochrome P450 n=1 Tax=Streptomyces sp. NPDC020490 TaxID=3365078 RepID=UPI003794450B